MILEVRHFLQMTEEVLEKFMTDAKALTEEVNTGDVVDLL